MCSAIFLRITDIGTTSVARAGLNAGARSPGPAGARLRRRSADLPLGRGGMRAVRSGPAVPLR